MIIGVTYCGNPKKQTMYCNWLQNADARIKIVELSASNAMDVPVESLDGILFTGGADIHPDYSHAEPVSLVNETDIERDRFELGLLNEAVSLQKPILGICRGMQLVNVGLGGTLYADLPNSGFTGHDCSEGDALKRQSVQCERSSRLFAESSVEKFEINSYHHQGVKSVANQLHVTAVAQDGIIEALEQRPSQGLPDILCVQWHPERMDIQNETASAIVAGAFIRSIIHTNEAISHHQEPRMGS